MINSRPRDVRTILAGCVVLAIALSPSLPAQTSDPETVLGALFTQGADAVEYTDAMTQAVSTAQLQAIVDQVTEQLGTFDAVVSAENPYTVLFAEGSAVIELYLSDAGKIGGIRFIALNPQAGSLDEAVQRLTGHDGTVSVYATRNGRTVVSERSDEPLAVGSAFKLAVLAAVEDAVSRGDTAWDDVVRLAEDRKSLPSGILQDWPADAPLTVHTLATLMISVSDNTATDALIAHVGRGRVERWAPHSTPLLSTREFFVLKDPANGELRRRFLSGDEVTVRDALERTRAMELPDPSIFAGDPHALEVEWFFTTAELCALMESVAHLDVTGVNSGVVDPRQWDRVAFKGGSEPGVFNLTQRLVAHDGTVFCVSATINRSDHAVNESAFVADFQRLIGALSESNDRP